MSNPSAHHKDGGNAYRSAMDKVLERNPPVIVWRKNKRGVLIAVSIRDPHTDYTQPTSGRWGQREPSDPPHLYLDILAAEEAAEESPLLKAARKI